MLNCSDAFIHAIQENNTCIAKADIKLKDKKEPLRIMSSDIMQGGVKISEGTSNHGSFDIGAAIINKLTLTLNNQKDKFSNIDFTGAEITLWIGKLLYDADKKETSPEWCKKGVFTSDDPKANTSILTIEALDNMEKFDREYNGGLDFPTNLKSIIEYCCAVCCVDFKNITFNNADFEVQEDPFLKYEKKQKTLDGKEKKEKKITYREILSYCAQIACCFAKCNTDGKLELKWYPNEVFQKADSIGTIKEKKPLEQTKYLLDSILYTKKSNKIVQQHAHHIYKTNSLEIATDDVFITGVKVTASNQEKDGEVITGETSIPYKEGYVLNIEKNPLIMPGQAQKVGKFLEGILVEKRFRKMSASILGDPRIEAGDAAFVTDRKGYTYYCYITNLTYTLNGYERIATDAKTPSRNVAKRYSETAKALIEYEKQTEAKLSQYEYRAQRTNELSLSAMGFYKTIERTNDGSIIVYMHDKKEKIASQYIWKFSREGFFISDDKGQTYKSGISKEGDAVIRMLSANRISADRIDTRGLIAMDKKGNQTFKIDAETGQVMINAELLKLQNSHVITDENMEAKIRLLKGELYEDFNRKIEGIKTSYDNMLTGTTLRTNKYVRYKSKDNSVVQKIPTQTTMSLSKHAMQIGFLNSGKGIIKFSKNALKLQKGKTYTISVKMGTLDVKELNVTFGMTSDQGASSLITLTEDFKNYSYTFTPTKDDKPDYDEFFIQIHDDLRIVSRRSVLEKINELTDKKQQISLFIQNISILQNNIQDFNKKVDEITQKLEACKEKLKSQPWQDLIKAKEQNLIEEKQQADIEISEIENGKFNITIKNITAPPEAIHTIWVPIWHTEVLSSANYQWGQATFTDDKKAASFIVDLRTHDYKSGVYNIHLWGRNEHNQNIMCIASTTLNVASITKPIESYLIEQTTFIEKNSTEITNIIDDAKSVVTNADQELQNIKTKFQEKGHAAKYNTFLDVQESLLKISPIYNKINENSFKFKIKNIQDLLQTNIVIINKKILVLNNLLLKLQSNIQSSA